MSQPPRTQMLVALVAALDPGDALQSIAGASVLERQLRGLGGAGAARVVMLVDELPPAMAALVGRLREESVRVDLVRSLAEAAPLLAGAARVLVLAEGCLPDPALIARVANAPVPAVATLADGEGMGRYERIDATTRWAGLALVDGVRIADTAAMLGEWDPLSTLLRRAVQEEAHRIAAEVPPLLAGDAPAIADAARLLLLGARRGRRGWARRRIEGPLSDRLLPLLLERDITRGLVGWAAAGLALLAGVVCLGGWRWPALAGLLVSGITAACADQLQRLHGAPLAERAPQRRARLAGLGLAMLGLGVAAWRGDNQWGWIALAVFTGLMLGATEAAIAFARRFGLDAELPWRATAGAMPWVMLPFALSGLWSGGIGALAVYALVSLGALARRLQRQPPEGSQRSATGT